MIALCACHFEHALRNNYNKNLTRLIIYIVVYIILGHHYEHVGLMLSLKQKGLLDKGEYFVVGIDIEQYDASAPDKYLRGLLQDETDDDFIIAFKSYLGIVPSPPSTNFEEFARQVIIHLCNLIENKKQKKKYRHKFKNFNLG